MKTIVHVNQHVIKANRKNGTNEPCLTVKDYKENRYGPEAIIRDKDGNEVARVGYRPHKPLSCGAHCWSETQLDVDVEVDTDVDELSYPHEVQCRVGSRA